MPNGRLVHETYGIALQRSEVYRDHHVTKGHFFRPSGGPSSEPQVRQGETLYAGNKLYIQPPLWDRSGSSSRIRDDGKQSFKVMGTKSSREATKQCTAEHEGVSLGLVAILQSKHYSRHPPSTEPERSMDPTLRQDVIAPRSLRRQPITHAC